MTDEQLAVFLHQIVARIMDAALHAETVMKIENVPDSTRRTAMASFETLTKSLEQDVFVLTGD